MTSKKLTKPTAVLLLYTFGLEATALAAVRPLLGLPRPAVRSMVAQGPPAFAASERAGESEPEGGRPAGVQPVAVAPAAQQSAAGVGGERERVDFHAWTQEGDPAAGEWVVADDGSVRQGIAGGASLFLSPRAFMNVTLEGRVRVTAAAAANGRFGFVLGYRESADAGGEPLNGHEYVLLEWTPRASAPRIAGLTAYGLRGDDIPAQGVVAPGADGTLQGTGVALLARTAEHEFGWKAGREYEVEIRYRRGRVSLRIDGQEVFKHDAPFAEGRLGFFTYGQAGATFRDFTAVVSNAAPVADAGPDQTVDAGPGCAALVSLDGSGSSDTDDDVLSYAWSGSFGTTEGLRPKVRLEKGVHEVTLSVDDGNGTPATDTVEIHVVDNEPPQIACPAGIVVPTNGAGCSATSVALAGAPTATDNCSVESVSSNAPEEYPLGTTLVTWSVADGSGYLAQCLQEVTVLDANAPSLTATVGKPQLWPPNHELVDVGLQTSASDPCGGSPRIHLKVFADEPENYQTGDGNRFPDAVITAPRLDLRSERRGDADGRVYLLLLTATDEVGNGTTVCRTSVVPHSQSRNDVDAVNAQALAASSYCQANGAAPEDYFLLAEGDLTRPNQAPRVDAGADQRVVLPASTVMLAGTVTDDGLPAGATLTTTWSMVSGPSPVTFSSASTLLTEASFTEAGTYVLRLSASDTALSSHDDTLVVVYPRNRAPQVSAGPDHGLSGAGGTVSLLGAVSDDGLPLGGSLTQQWSVVSGPGTVSFANASSPATTATFSVMGTYLLRLTASDGELLGADEMQVVPFNTPPAVDAGPAQAITLPTDTVTLTGSAVDDGLPAGGSLTVRWSVRNGPAAVVFGSPDEPITTARFGAPGVYVLQLAAGDTAATTTDTVTVVVNAAPVVSAGADQIIDLPTNATALDGTVSDDGLPPGTAVTQRWSKVSGPGEVSFASATSEDTTATFSQGGTYVLQLEAGDTLAIATDTVTVVVNAPPLVSAGPDQEVVLPGGVATLSGSASDDGLPAGSALSVHWSAQDSPGPVEFGSPEAAVTTATFTAPGEYVLRLAATDGRVSASDDVKLVVTAPLAQLSITDASIEEGSGGLREAVLRLSLSQPLPVEAAVDYATTPGTASADCDYLPRYGTVSFPVGVAEQTVRVPVVGDLMPEPDEQLTVRLGNEVNVGLLRTEATITIVNDDQANARPSPPSDRTPANGERTALRPTLSWASSDPDAGDTVVHDVYFGTSFGTTGQSWQRTCASGPSPRSLMASGYDDASDRLFIFGGRLASGHDSAELWLLSDATGSGASLAWSPVATTGGPTARRKAAAVLDPNTGRLLVHGGCTGDCTAALDDTWVLTSSGTWAALPAAPEGRSGHAAAYDPTSNRLLVFGGFTAGPGTETNDVLVLADANGDGAPVWEQFAAAGTPPTPRSGASAVYDAVGNRLLVFGGRGGDGVALNDVWVLSEANGLGGEPAWGQLQATGLPPAARYGHGAGYDPATGRMVVYGGTTADPESDLNFVLSDTWLLTGTDTSTPAWVPLNPGIRPTGRYGAAVAYSFTQNRLVATLGANNKLTAGALGDTWLLDAAIGSLPLVSVGQSTSTFDPGALIEGARHFWRIVARDTHGASTGSPAWSFLPGHPEISVEDVSVVEGDSGTTPAVFTLALSHPSPTEVRVAYATTDVSATAGVDYQAAGGTAVFAPGATSATISVAVLGDTTFETDEALQLLLTAPEGATLARSEATGTILDDETQPNAAPIVNAGPDQEITTRATTLVGVVSDDGLPAGSEVGTEWEVASGPGVVTFGDSRQVLTTASFGAPGVYVVRLTATDGELGAADTLTVTVTLTNQAPTVDVGADRLASPGVPIALEGRVADDGLPAGRDLTFAWTKMSGPGEVQFGTATGAATTAVFQAVGTYEAKLTASDSELSGSDTLTVTVQAQGNQPPIVSAGPDQLVSHATAIGGRLVVNNDDWTLSDTGFAQTSDTARFARNIASWFAPRGNGRFLAYSSHFGLTQGQLANTIRNAGHQWTVSTSVSFTLATLEQYDGVWLCGNVADQAVLIDYVNQGGNVYVCAGTGWGPGDETARWNTFLGAFGLRYTGDNGISGLLPVSSAHPVMQGVSKLYMNGGNTVSLLRPTDPQTQMLMTHSSGQGLVAIFANAGITLNGSVQDDGLPLGAAVTSQWSLLSGPAPAPITDASSPVTSVLVTAGGTYVFRLSATDTQLTGADDVTIVVNEPPVVTATATTGTDPGTMVLTGTVADDGLPAGGTLVTHWSLVSGPGSATIADAAALETTASVTSAGTYVFRLSASDGHLASSADATANMGVITYADGAWKYKVVAFTQLPGFQAPGYDDSAFTVGSAAFGSHTNTCPLDQYVRTPWVANTDLLLRRTFVVLDTNQDLVVGIAIDNDVQVWVNGIDISNGMRGREGCASRDSYLFTIPKTILVVGENLLAVRARDRGGVAYFDASLRPKVVTANNHAPVVDAGEDRTVPLGQTVTIFGYVQDDGLPAGAMVSAFWSQVSGPAPFIVFDSTPSATGVFGFPVPGEYVLRLAASDTQINSFDDVTVTVLPPNTAPTINAGPDQTMTLPVRTVTLSGTVADDGQPTGASIVTTWAVTARPAGASVTFGTPNQPATTATFSSAGQYTLTLSASDSELSGSDSVEVTVNPSAGPNTAPEVHVEPPGALGIGGNLLRNGSGEAPIADGQVPGWTQVRGDWTTSANPIPAFIGGRVFLAPQAEYAEIAQDADVSALPFQQPLELVAYLRSADEATPDTARLLLEYRDASGTPFAGLDSGPLSSISDWLRIRDSRPVPAGTVSVRLRLITERQSGETNDAAWDAVSLRAPGLALARLTGTVNDDGLPVGAAVTQAWSSISDPARVQFKNPSEASTPAAFSAAGSYVLRLAATDGALSSAAEATAAVAPANQAPVVNAGPDASLTLPNDTVTLAGAVTDPDGPSAPQVVWTQTAGPVAAALATPRQATTSVRFPTAGTYVLRLRGDDSEAVAIDEVTVIVRPTGGTNQPPTVSAGPSRVITLPATTTTLEGSVSDDGLPVGAQLSITWTLGSGPGSVQFASPHSPITSATFTSAGTYVLRLTASDTESSSFAEVAVTVATEGSNNQAPYVSAGPDQVVPLAAGANLAGTAVDDGRPAGGAFAIQWSQVSGPSGVVFTSPSQAMTVVRFPAVGNYVLRLTAGDSEITSTDDVLIRVNAANQAPVVNAGADQAITYPDQRSVALAGTLSDDGLPAGATVQVLWGAIDPPAPVGFSSPDAPSTTVFVSQPGTYVLQLSAFDGEQVGTDRVTLVVNAGNNPPVVNAGADQTLTVPSLAATLAGSVQDDGQPAGGALTSTWTQVSGPAGVTFATPSAASTTVTFDGPGTYVLRLSGNDGALTSKDDVVVAVQGQAPVGDPPTATIISPTDGGSVSAPTDVVGSVVSASLLRWRLEYRAQGAAAWTTLGTGDTPVTGAPLASFDPTMLLNGLYELRLTATDQSGRRGAALLTVVVRDDMKLGQFSLSFTDLEIPLTGVPIRVERSYDSRDKRPGDFGYGWRLAVSSVELTETGTLGEGWVSYVNPGWFPQYCVNQGQARRVTVTLPGGRVYEFEPTLYPNCTLFPSTEQAVSFRARPGTLATLEAIDSVTVVNSQNWGGQNQTREMQLFDANTFRLYDPSVYRFTLRDGTAFLIDQSHGGLQTVTDPNGNVLTLQRGADSQVQQIVHSSGRGVVFTRDAAKRITGVTDPEGHAITYAYDGNGDLVSVTDREDNTTSFTYETAFPHHLKAILDPLGRTPIRNDYYPDGRIWKHTDAFDNTIVYDHDISGRQELVTDRNGKLRVLHYDDRGNVVKEVQPDGRQVLRTFDARNNRLTETEAHDPGTANPPKTTWTYDAQDNLTSTTDALGNRAEQTYDAKGRVLTSKDARNKVTTNVYTGANLTKTTDAVGTETRYTYDSKGNLTGQTVTAAGLAPQTTTYAHDYYGNVTSETNAAGHATTYTNNLNGARLSQTTTRTLPGGGIETLTTTYEYDANGKLTKTTEPDGSVSRTVYDALGRQMESYDKLNHRTTSTYDVMGRLVKTTYVDGTFEESTYDAEGRRLTSKDRGGRTTSYEYDDQGRLKKTIQPDSSVTQTVYDAAGRVDHAIDARLKSTFFTYDAAGRRTKVRDALGNETLFVYDAAGNQTSVRDARLNTTTYDYDDLNRRTKTTFPDGTFTTTAYDALGRRTAETDQGGKTTSFEYDALGRLTKVTDALDQETAYAYDELGNRISQTDANGHTTRFEYDRMGRETARVLPDGAREEKAYDAAGNLTLRRDFQGRETTYDYDVTNRLVARNYPDASTVSFTYTATGRRETATDTRGTTSYAYDARDRLTTLTYPDGRKLEFGYDANGSRVRVTAVLADASRYETTMTYDDLSRLDLVTDLLGRTYDHGYDANGNRAGLTQPNGAETAYTYDALNRLTNLTTTRPASGTTIQSYALTLGAAGNRTRIAEHDGNVRDYAYDDLYRLVRETVTQGALPQYEKLFAYDPVGNRLNQTTAGAGAPGTPTAAGSTAYGYDTRDRITTEGTQAYTWDANGNLTTKTAEATYIWDFENRLTRVEKTDGTVVDHVYDADGARVRTSTTLPGQATQVVDYLVDTSGSLSHVVAETAGGTGTLQALYVRGDDLLSVMRPDGAGGWNSRFFHADHIGSIRRLTDETGNITDGYTYSAFGELISHTGSDPQPYAFAGEPLDPNSGFQYHRARWMDPSTAQFESVDPIRGRSTSPQSLHTYAYAASDPANRVDPSGRSFLGSATLAAGIAVAIMATQAAMGLLTVTRLLLDGDSDPPNPWGQQGKPDHQLTVAYLVQLAQAEFPDDIIHESKSIKAKTGLSRLPDVWVEDSVTGKVKKVYEAARTMADGVTFVVREQTKMKDYLAHGIPYHFEKVKPLK